MSTVLVINAGSSSIKYQLVDPAAGAVTASGLIERIGEPAGAMRHTVGEETFTQSHYLPDAQAAFAQLTRAFAEHGPDLGAIAPVAIGHRVVHGGTRFSAATVVTDDVLQVLEEITPLAPLHNPANIAGIRAARESFPALPQIAVFDTAFHATIPPAAYTYAVPRQWREEYGVRRYGFHGTSHQYVSQRVSDLIGRDDLATVVLHLGNGCSATAVLAGRSVETSMGMTPLEGLVMGTRCGDIDPAIPFHLARVAGLGVDELDVALNKQSGLKGLTGANDFRSVNELAASGDADARLAIDVVAHRLVKYVGAYAAAMGRLDAIAFTGGIGENDPALRQRVLQQLAFLGVSLDEEANRARGAERAISTPQSRVAAYVIATNEELQIARECLEVLSAGTRRDPTTS